MMQIAAEKGCWLSDLDNVPASELAYWIAYYQLEEEKRKREEARRGSSNK
jgi:hypothetical protein